MINKTTPPGSLIATSDSCFRHSALLSLRGCALHDFARIQVVFCFVDSLRMQHTATGGDANDI